MFEQIVARRVSPGAIGAGLLLLAGLTSIEAAEPRAPLVEIDFSRDIRPLLSDRCFQCHGPSETTREADLRLDVRAGAFAKLEDHYAIVPNDLENSALYQRIVSNDPDELMPPADSGKKLTPRQIALIRRWIEQGAPWREHWAFERPLKAALPNAKPANGENGAIDGFVLQRLKAGGLSFSPAADRRTLIRRVTFDLTGLPPSMEEVEAFVRDRSPDPYEKVVDRLLKSPHHGEHMARFWLDVARYGDTHGLHLDNYREMWPYRDWVIRAFNSNMPFDQFVVKQIAGDLLPNATLDDQIATGFSRCHVTTNEGGTIAEEFYVRNVVDRVETMGQAFLGLTLGCAVCHEHKFDPISQTEFYQLFAFFNNLDAGSMDGNAKTHPPYVHVPTPEQTRKVDALRAKIASTLEKRHALVKQGDSALREWAEQQRQALAQAEKPRLKAVEPEGLAAQFAFDEGTGPKAANRVDAKQAGTIHGPGGWTQGVEGGGFQFADQRSYIDLGRLGNYKKAQPFSLGVWLKTPGDVDGAVIARMDNSRIIGYEVQVKQRRGGAIFGRYFPNQAIYVVTTEEILSPDTWHHVFVTYEGTGRASGVEIYVDGRRQDVEIEGDTLGRYDFNTGKPLLLGRRDALRPFRGGSIDDFRIYERCLGENEVAQVAFGTQIASLLALPATKRSEVQRNTLQTYYFNGYDAEYRKLTEQIAKLRHDVIEVESQMITTMVFRERDEVRPAFYLDRGEYDRQRQEVQRATPSIFPPIPEGSPMNRLGLARWLVSKEQPLTSRVAVNRFWQQVFGTGIVKTSEDFGSQGEPPSHPKLLDWLAVDFEEHGWNVRRLMKQIVMSRTYRQSSNVSAELFERDPENRLFARGPRFRLDAEMLRDQALAVSGLLVPRIGGPSVKPPQPRGTLVCRGLFGIEHGQVRERHRRGQALSTEHVYVLETDVSAPADERV